MPLAAVAGMRIVFINGSGGGLLGVALLGLVAYTWLANVLS